MPTPKHQPASKAAGATLGSNNKRKTTQPPPVRLADRFYKRMNAAAKINARSVPKHLEYMVNIAESISARVSREDLLDVQSGLSKIVVEKVTAPHVDKAALLDSINTMRTSGTLSQTVTKAATKYQASPSNPGYLERINEDDTRDIGQFKGGKFITAKDLA